MKKISTCGFFKEVNKYFKLSNILGKFVMHKLFVYRQQTATTRFHQPLIASVYANFIFICPKIKRFSERKKNYGIGSNYIHSKITICFV